MFACCRFLLVYVESACCMNCSLDFSLFIPIFRWFGYVVMEWIEDSITLMLSSMIYISKIKTLYWLGSFIQTNSFSLNCLLVFLFPWFCSPSWFSLSCFVFPLHVLVVVYLCLRVCVMLCCLVGTVSRSSGGGEEWQQQCACRGKAWVLW